MAHCKNTTLQIFGSVTALIILFLSDSACAQISPDNTLETESSRLTNVEIDGRSIEQIDGGAERGANLFHSFEKFNVRDGQSVYFANPQGIDNILSRVTGSSRSEILGRLGVLGSADLFMLNPNGIIFGENATLDVNGSFIASTADSVRFESDLAFSATDPKSPPLLTINTPTGLQFGESPASIVNQSIGRDENSPDLDLVGLQVKSQNTLALLGGNIIMQAGSLTASNGRIELGSIGRNGLVKLQPIDRGWMFNYENVDDFLDIELSQSQRFITEFDGNIAFPSLLNGFEGADTRLQARNIVLSGGSQLRSTGSIEVNALEKVELSGISESPFSNTGGFLSQALFSENGGSIDVKTKKLIIQDGAEISVQVSGFGMFDENENLIFIPASGNGGNIFVNASEFVEISGNNSGIFSGTEGFGDAGNIRIETSSLTFKNNAAISAESKGFDFLGNPLDTGLSGNIEIDAQDITIDKGILTSETRVGSQGNITLENADTLLLRNNSQVTTNAIELATGGDISIDSEAIATLDDSDITANAIAGRGGNIQITTQGIFQEPNSEITAASELGIDGTVTFNTPDVDPASGIFELPDIPIDAAGILAQDLCKFEDEKIAKGSSFIITGRGGLTSTSEGSLENRDRIVNWTSRQDLEVSNNGTVGLRQREAPDITNQASPKIKQSQGLFVADDGSTWLTANAPDTAPQAAKKIHPDCQTQKSATRN